MTENEAIEVLKDFGKQVSVKADGAYQSTIGEKACDVAINALEEIQKYRKIEKDLKENYHANVDIPLLIKHFIETVFKGEKHEGFCILTNEDKEAWEEYQAIGTLEECRAAVEKQKAKKIEIFNGQASCPNCKLLFGGMDVIKSLIAWDMPHCNKCGQRLDWSEEE